MPGAIARMYWGEKMLMAVIDLEPHGVVPAHSHPHEQIGLVIEGELSFIIGGEAFLLGPGDVYVIPGDVEHSATAGETAVKAIDIFSPVREEFKY